MYRVYKKEVWETRFILCSKHIYLWQAKEKALKLFRNGVEETRVIITGDDKTPEYSHRFVEL